MDSIIVVVAVVLAVLLTWALTYRFAVKRWKDEAEEMSEYEAKYLSTKSELEGKDAFYEERLKAEKASLETQVQNLKEKLQEEKALHAESLTRERASQESLRKELRDNYDKSLEELKKNHQASLSEQAEAYEKQSDALKAEMLAKTEEILKKRQEELDKKATETFESITGNLGKDLKEMKTAFEENKTKSSEDSASMKEKFENAVKQLSEQTKSIGDKADHLAEAMRGQKKMQGCWGETILQNLLDAEGLVEGRDYDKEETLRDEMGFVIQNEDTDKRMRPDYIIHFVDKQDVIVDSKVSLSAYVDYTEASTEEARAEASARNLNSIKEQVKKLAAKKYSEYLKQGHRMVDYVVMFVPNYAALQLAYNQDSTLWRWAYDQKVLITSQETLMPFLRTIFLAWRNVEQVRNQQKIIDSAQKMVNRVAELASSMQTLGRKLEEANKAYTAADKKLRNSGQSILVSANQVINLGVPLSATKTLPELDYNEEDTLQIESGTE